MRTLWYGGSFNPVHRAHVECARAVALSRGFKRVVLVPSAVPPHKPGQTALASFADRKKMCELAVAGDPLFAVSDLESHRSGPSYTIDTVRELHDIGERDITWLIGADQLMALPTWRKAEALLDAATILIVARPGTTIDFDALPKPFQRLRDNLVEAPLLDITATEIRARATTGKPIEHLVGPAVARYIAERGLYRAA